MSVEAATAGWLKSECDYAVAETAAGAWDSVALTSELKSPFATRVAAYIEAFRQLLFLNEPMAVERVKVDGLRIDLVGRRIDLTTDRAGISAARCIVIGAEEQNDEDATILIVLRKMT